MQQIGDLLVNNGVTIYYLFYILLGQFKTCIDFLSCV